MRFLAATLVLLAWACSHDLSAVPRDGGADERELDAAEDSGQDFFDAGPDDVGLLDVAPDDAGPLFAPTYELGDELSVNGAAAVGDEIVVVGEGVRGPDGPQAVVAVLGRDPRAIEFGGLGPDRLTDVAAFGDRVVMVGGVRGFEGTQVDGLIAEMVGADLSTLSTRAVRYTDNPQLLRAVAMDENGYVAVGSSDSSDGGTPRGLVVVEGDPERVYTVSLGRTAIVFHDVAITDSVIYAAGSSDTFGFLVAIDRWTGVHQWTREVEVNTDALTSYRGVAVVGTEVVAVGPGGFHTRYEREGGHLGTVGYGAIGFFAGVEVLDGREWVVGLGSGDLIAGSWDEGAINGWESIRMVRTIEREYWSAITMTADGPVAIVGGPGADSLETALISLMPLDRRPTECSTSSLGLSPGNVIGFMNRGMPAAVIEIVIVDQDEELSPPSSVTLTPVLDCSN